MKLPPSRQRRLGPNGLRAVLIFFFAVTAHGQTVVGTVRDAEGGTPLRSMVVAAYTTAGTLQANVTTDTNGRYELSLPAGRYRVLAYDPAGVYATQFANDAPSFEESPEVVVAGLQSVTIDFRLLRGGSVSGFVLTSGGLRAGMTVTAYNLSSTRRGFTTTNSFGGYSIVLPPGDYKMVAYDDAAAFAVMFFRDRTSFVEADVVRVTAGRNVAGVDFFLPLGARVAGTIADASGMPIPNATVIVYTATGQFVTFAAATSDGRFMLILPPGAYRFVAVDNSFTFAAGYVDDAKSFETSPAITLSGGQSRSDLSFRLARGGLVAGQVIDATTGTPLAAITVAAYNIDGTLRTSVSTDANGRYVLLLPAGTFRIAAFDPSLVYATQFQAAQNSFARALVISTVAGQTITLQPFALSRAGRVTGLVVDDATGAPLAGVTVAAFDSDGILVATTTTSATGTYRLALAAGTYRLIGFDSQLRYAPGYIDGATSFDTSTPITVTTEDNTLGNLRLRRGTRVSGSVVDDAQRPVSGVEVTALDMNQNRVASATTTADGTFQFALAPGTYKLVVIDPSGRYSVTYFGGTTFLTAGTVTVDATGAPRITVMVHGGWKRRAVHH